MYRVLIVDDEPIFRIGLRSIVNWENYGFYVQDDAKNGLEALKIVEEDHPDLIFLDIKMPVMSGIDFLNAMKGCIFRKIGTPVPQHRNSVPLQTE